NGKIAKMSQKFGTVSVTPNHSIYDVYGNLTIPEKNPWLLNMRKINYVNRGRNDLFEISLQGSLSDDDYIWCKNQSDKKIKKNITDIAPLFRFIGAFIAEGHTTFNKANDSFLSGISSQDIDWLKSLQDDLYTFYEGPSCLVRHKKDTYKDVWELQISSEVLH